MSGPGFGNKTSSDPTVDEGDDSYRFGKHTEGGAYQGAHPEYGSGATGGAGFGNKSNPDPNLEEYDNTDLRFGSHSSTAPYQGGTEHGSGSTGGAGFGNKTGHMTSHDDSVIGKMMEKVGGIVHNEGLIEKGRAKREKEGLGKDESSQPLAN